MKKVSFDFDDTLDRQSVFNYAQELIANGVEVWVCTARTSDANSQPRWNDDLYKVTSELGIPKSQIVFMEYVDKYEFFNGKDFIWHIDDNFEEADNITKYTDTVGIRYYSNGDWLNECKELLK